MARANKRDEIIQHAYPIFLKQGFHATGVDTVLAESGISKRTLYKYFRSKEALIAALVFYYQQHAFDELSSEMTRRAGMGDAIGQILSLFDVRRELLEAGDYSGCFAINAKLEFQDKEAQVEESCGLFYSQLEKFIADLCTQAHCHAPRQIAKQVVMLFQGGLVYAQMQRDPESLERARMLAKTLLEQSITQ